MTSDRVLAGTQSDTQWNETVQIFLDTFIRNETELDVGLPASLKYQLDHLLPLGYGQQYLMQAQEHAFKVQR